MFRGVAGLALLGLALPAPAGAGKADVVDVAVLCEEGLCVFAVTVRHDDTGWDHFADRWEILDAGGRVLATRVLAHPHVGEQPFTRRLPGVRIPEGLESVRVRARDSVHGYGGGEKEIAIPAASESSPAPEGPPS